METTASLILTINGGSSSIKFALFEREQALRRVLKGSIEGIGGGRPMLRVVAQDAAKNQLQALSAPDHGAAISALLAWLDAGGAGQPLAAVGHRIVHGGPDHDQAQVIGAPLLAQLQQLRALDPGHLPAELALVEALQDRYPRLPQVACFDTAFHHALPRVARMLPIPRRFEAQGVRRYGFHGLSYSYLMQALATVAGADAARGRIILAHLGNGASLAAVRDGRVVDTSMGFTPSAGLPMGSRSGDLDPGLGAYLARSEAMTPAGFEQMVNFQSGLLGISETSADMRELLAVEAEDIRAAEAVALFCYQAKKWIGAYAAALGGLDTLVFSGGIGEHAPVVRQRICAGLEFLGIELDEHGNANNAPLISTPAARVAVRVIATDEERVIAEAVDHLLAAKPP